MKELTVKENLEIARKKAHETMRKNGHYERMAQAKKNKAKKKSKKKLSTD